MGVLNCCKVQMLAPNERSKPLKISLSGFVIARAHPRLDMGRTFPCAPLSLVIKLGCGHRHAHGRHRRIRAQPQVCSKDVTIAGLGADCFGYSTDNLHKCVAHIGHIITGIAAIIKEANQINVA